MPLVTVPVRRSGEPMATTWSPTLRLSELPNLAALRPLAPSSLIRARSLSGSVPTTFALYFLPSLIVTWTSVAPLTTWLLVTISPSEVTTMPEPVPWPAAVVVSIRTTEGLTCSATPETVPMLDCETLEPVTPPSLPPRWLRYCWIPAEVPPPMMAAAMATAAIRAKERRGRACPAEGAVAPWTSPGTGGCGWCASNQPGAGAAYGAPGVVGGWTGGGGYAPAPPVARASCASRS